MNNDFFKFPSTPHLATFPGMDIRDDKVFSEPERADFLSNELCVEEKVDGANLGISFDSSGNVRVQNRGGYLELPGSGQWKKLDDWLSRNSDPLFDILSDRYILFGEWCYAQHSIFYDLLPDWFLAFDIYDIGHCRFLSCARRDRELQNIRIATVPFLARGRFSYTEITAMVSQSKVGGQPAEGIYLRVDQGDWLDQRAKLVRPAFIQSVAEHWTRSSMRTNRLRTRDAVGYGNGDHSPAH